MEIVLIRHGQPEWSKDGFNQENPPLTDVGERQAIWMAEALADEHFDEVLVSPLLRARQTAAPLYERLGRDEVVAPWLEEIGDPPWHGTPTETAAQAYKELAERPVLDRWEGLDGGESVRDFAHRIGESTETFLAERGLERHDYHDLPVWTPFDESSKIALVAHTGTNSMMIGHLLGMPPIPWQWDRIVIGHASISRVVALPVRDGCTFSLQALSNLEHIPHEHRTR